MKLDLPELNEGEIYCGAIINPDGTGNHFVLLDGEIADVEWDYAMAWAKAQGGDLPSRVEQALLFDKLKDRFKKTWYWSNTQHASDSDYAGSQDFYNGYQNYWHKTTQVRARAVRRLAIRIKNDKPN
jgi:hypothetical protein